jgi:flavin-dependent dehydrogenase
LPKPDSGQPLDNDALHFYKGRFPSSIAQGYYGDRYVMIGDASGLVRAFKGKGSTTAMVTGIRAAETIMTKGISRQVFDEFYRQANQDIISDLPYGQAMRRFTIFTSRFGLLDPVLRAAQVSPDLRDALYDAVSGHGYYKDVLKKSLRLDVIGAIIRALFQKSSQIKA